MRSLAVFPLGGLQETYICAGAVRHCNFDGHVHSGRSYVAMWSCLGLAGGACRCFATAFSWSCLGLGVLGSGFMSGVRCSGLLGLIVLLLAVAV
jgi:hypothetical protein